jgi:hypothetical protein
MRIFMKASLILLALGLMAQPLSAQVDLNDTRTPEQKWDRAVVFSNFGLSGMIALGKEADMTAEEIGRFFGEWGAPSWGAPGDTSLAEFVWWYHRNYNIYRGLEFELLSESESEIQGRMNTPYAGFFGDDRQAYGVTLDEFRTTFLLAYEVIADYLGFDMTHEVSGEWVNFTVKTR